MVKSRALLDSGCCSRSSAGPARDYGRSKLSFNHLLTRTRVGGLSIRLFAEGWPSLFSGTPSWLGEEPLWKSLHVNRSITFHHHVSCALHVAVCSFQARVARESGRGVKPCGGCSRDGAHWISPALPGLLSKRQDGRGPFLR